MFAHDGTASQLAMFRCLQAPPPFSIDLDSGDEEALASRAKRLRLNAACDCELQRLTSNRRFFKGKYADFAMLRMSRRSWRSSGLQNAWGQHCNRTFGPAYRVCESCQHWQPTLSESPPNLRRILAQAQRSGVRNVSALSSVSAVNAA